MLVRIFFFVIIVIVIFSAVLNIKQNNNENFTDTKKLHYDGSVHLKGDVLVNNIPNKITQLLQLFLVDVIIYFNNFNSPFGFFLG